MFHRPYPPFAFLNALVIKGQLSAGIMIGLFELTNELLLNSVVYPYEDDSPSCKEKQCNDELATFMAITMRFSLDL